MRILGSPRARGIGMACALLVAIIDLAPVAPRFGRAIAAPGPSAADKQATVADKYKQALAHVQQGDYEGAKTLVDEGLALAPRDLGLLELRGRVLLETRDFEGALAAYQAFLDAGAPPGANRRAAQKIVAALKSVKKTSLEVTVTNGPARVYLDSRAQGVFCQAAPSCKRGLPPGEYKVIVERDGYERTIEKVTVKMNEPAKLSATLTELPSPVTVASTQAGDGAQITVDGKPAGAAPQKLSIPAGDHEIAIGADGFAIETRKLSLHDGKPEEITVTLRERIPVTTSVKDAELYVDGAAAEVQDGGVVLPNPGAHVISAKAKGYHEQKQELPAEHPRGMKIALELSPVGAMVSIVNAPRGARFYVDGMYVATHPFAAPVEVAGGEHTLELQKDGYLPFRQRTTLTNNTSAVVNIVDMRPLRRTKTWITAGVAGAAMVGGVVLGSMAQSKASEYTDRVSMPGVTYQDTKLKTLEQDGTTYAQFSDAGWGVAIAAGGLASYFFFTETHGTSPGHVEPMVGPAGVGVSGSF